MKRKWILFLLLAWLLPTMACNMPVSSAPDVHLTARQTLAAKLFATPAAESTARPLPDQPQEAQPEQPLQLTVVPPAAYDHDHIEYLTRSGDTLAALALRFGVEQTQILNPQQYPPQLMLPSGVQLNIPNTFANLPPSTGLLPDSEIVYSPSSVGFSVEDIVRNAGGFLSTYTEKVDNDTLTGAQIVQRVADETSINPRLLLAVLEYRSHWVFDSPADGANNQYPIGFYANQYSGLYKEITLTARQLTIGYYGWRSGSVTEIEFANGTHQRISPTVNAGTAAMEYLFAKLYDQAHWQTQLYDPALFLTFYQEKFGDPWQRAAAVEPLLPDHLAQPDLELPFPPGETWTLTGGPHAAWGVGSPWGGLDFAPANVEKGCTVSRFWATAAAPGVVLRSANGQVIEDLDGDGNEQTGWVLLYLHVAEKERVAVGTQLNTNDRIGHPSCEGGVATGTHVHIARKYNGEWFAADSPVPFVLSGWQAWPGARAYSGSLTKADQLVTARLDNTSTSLIVR